MKIFTILLLVIFVLPVSEKLIAQQSRTLTITNRSSMVRNDELIVFTRQDIDKKMGSIPPAKFISIKSAGKNIVVQHDDLNKDGQWDEVVFVQSFQPSQMISFRVALANKGNVSEAVQRAHVRLKKKNPDETFGPSLTHEIMPFQNPATDFSKQPLPLYLTEGPGWENDKVAFRLYFDVRNGKDIFAKRTSRMVLDSVGVKVHPSYHDLNDWGMDVLHAGKSLGSGALALSVPQANGPDTLIRLGGENIKKTVYEQLADGPVRGMFRLSYEWKINGRPVGIAEEISIWGGQYFYESKVLVSGAPEGTKLLTGIASFYNNVFQCFPVAHSQVLLSHGRQSENKDNLGMAVVVPQKNFAFAGSTPNEGSDILNTYIMAQNITAGKPCRYRFYAGWEQTDNRFQSLNFFKNYLENEAKVLDMSLIVGW